MTLKKLTPHKKRQAIIAKLVNIPKDQKRFFWAREMKLLKDSAVDGQNAMMKKQKHSHISPS